MTLFFASERRGRPRTVVKTKIGQDLLINNLLLSSGTVLNLALVLTYLPMDTWYVDLFWITGAELSMILYSWTCKKQVPIKINYLFVLTGPLERNFRTDFKMILKNFIQCQGIDMWIEVSVKMIIQNFKIVSEKLP